MAPPDTSNMHTLKVDNVPFQCGPDDFRQVFEKYGEIGDIYIPREFGNPERTRGFAFVRFMEKRDAEDAIDGIMKDNVEMDGRPIRVSFAEKKRPERREGGYGRDNHRGGGGYRDSRRRYDDRSPPRRRRDDDDDYRSSRRRSRSPRESSRRSRSPRESSRRSRSPRESSRRHRSPPRDDSRSPPPRRSRQRSRS